MIDIQAVRNYLLNIDPEVIEEARAFYKSAAANASKDVTELDRLLQELRLKRITLALSNNDSTDNLEERAEVKETSPDT